MRVQRARACACACPYREPVLLILSLGSELLLVLLELGAVGRIELAHRHRVLALPLLLLLLKLLILLPRLLRLLTSNFLFEVAWTFA